ncbi:MAG: hypothetical protein K2Q28_05470 [Hyphomicrobium sp.]|nr:hypothetical protein [Hyphomicrobium sp.]
MSRENKIAAAFLLTCFFPPFAAVIAATYGVRWRCRFYAQVLKAQKEAESDPYVLRPFIHHGRAPMTAWLPPKLILMAVAGVTLLAASLGYFHAVNAIWVALGFAPILPIDTQLPLWGLLIVMAGWFVILHLFSKFIHRRYVEGRIFPGYPELLTHIRACKTSEAVLAYAPSLRAAAKTHIRRPYDLYRVWVAWRDEEDHAAYYRSERLLDALELLAQRFPYDSSDEAFRKRYWAYAQSLYRLLLLRDPSKVQHLLFAKPYPASPDTTRRDRDARLAQARAKPDIDLATHGELTRIEALEILGLTAQPDLATLKKLKETLLRDTDQDYEKEAIARAFKRLEQAYA